jgi:hypothetical protein
MAVATRHMAKHEMHPLFTPYFRIPEDLLRSHAACDWFEGTSTHVSKPYLRCFPSFSPSPSKPVESRGKRAEILHDIQQLKSGKIALKRTDTTIDHKRFRIKLPS